ncbi:MAG TPA: DUF4097 family beta strand repeat-containing protein [Acidobacteriota bacterium]|nr:DUF4097 family beta strand repeat-containing protein [Acidobacteriota bacterium]
MFAHNSKRLSPAGLGALTVLIALATATSLPAQPEKRLPASPGQLLVLDLQAGGSVSVIGWDRNEVLVSYDVRTGNPSDFQIDIEETGDGVRVRSGYIRNSRHWSSNMAFNIRVPRQFDIDLDSMGGGLSVVDVEGRFTGKTMGGELSFTNVRGSAEMKTMGGEIHLEDSDLDGSLRTMGGEVLFRNVEGDVRGSSMGGNVRYVNVRRRDGSLAGPDRTGSVPASSDTVQISTMGGRIDVDEAPEGASVHTMGGDIDVRQSSRFTRARTLGGDIYIESLDGWVEAATNGGDVEVHILGSGGDQHIDLSSLSGDVTLYLPADFAGQLEVRIAYTRDSRKSYRIISDFPLTEQRPAEWDYSRGSPRRYVIGQGTINGGGHPVRLETINGNITIRSR